MDKVLTFEEWASKRLKEIDNEYAEETQKQYNEMMSGTNCHCGKDGHPLNSMNCPVHGYEIRKKVKMTREEAIKCLGQVMSFNRYEFIACLEALGLIKFEEDEVNKQRQLLKRARILTSHGYVVSNDFDSVNELVNIIKSLLKIIDNKD